MYALVGALAVVAAASRLVPGTVGVWIAAIAMLLIGLAGLVLFGYFVVGAWLANEGFADASDIWAKRRLALLHGSILMLVVPVVSLTQIGRDPSPRRSTASATPPAGTPAAPPANWTTTDRRPPPTLLPVIPSHPPVSRTPSAQPLVVPRVVTQPPVAAPRVAAKPPSAQLSGDRPGTAPAVQPFAGGGAWVSALAGVQPARDALAGEWSAGEAGSPLAVSAAPGKGVRKIVLPVAPPADYQLRIRFVRTAGAKEWCVLLPVGGQGAQVWIGGMTGQTSSIHPFRQSRLNPAESPLVNGVEQELVFTVHGATDHGESAVDVTLDGKPYLAWRGDKARLTVEGRYALPDASRVGLAVHDASAVEFREVALR
jgi:hypothetical protein